MPVTKVANGVVVDAPSSIRVQPIFSGPAANLAFAGASTHHPTAVQMGLLNAGLQMAAEFTLSPQPGAAAGMALAPEGETPLRVLVSTKPGEHAVLLLQHPGGVLAWSYPSGVTTASDAGPALGPSDIAGAALQFVFGKSADRTASKIYDWVVGKVGDTLRGMVLKFVVGAAEDGLVNHLEGSKKLGLTTLAGEDPNTWKPGAATLPVIKPGQSVLLMVHGTFSDTFGSFGPLASTVAGKAFLQQARQDYAAIIGFDHKTLAASVAQNAQDMVAALKTIVPPGTAMDAVCYSRGGLVFRQFAETLVPQGAMDVELRKAAFVACTNGGTNLANPENWKTLVDLYTNIAVLGAQVVGALPGASSMGALLAQEAITTIGEFVKYLSVVGITDRRVPGLADMEPTGNLVQTLNAAAPAAAPIRYYAFTCDFDGKRAQPPITDELKEVLLDPAVDALLGDKNDLVVDTAFMTEFGKHAAWFNKANDLEALGTVGTAWHTVYFARDITAQTLAGWLP